MGIALQDFFQQGQPPSPVFSASLAFAEGLNSHPQAALEQFQRSLDFWQSCQEPITPSPDLRAALVLYYQGRYRSSDHPDYQAVRDDTTAWQALEQSVARFQAVQRPDLVAKACCQLGKVLETLENWSALETLAQDVLPLTQAQGTELAQAQVYGWLAAVALAKDTPKAATQTLDYAQQALDRVPGDHWERGQYLYQRGMAAARLGDTAMALEDLQTARKLDGPPEQQIRILVALQKLYTQEKDYLAAFQAEQAQLSVEQQYGLRAFIGAGRLEARRQRQDDLMAATEETVVPEIAASGRQQDLDALMQRIGGNDAKLIVLHGPSGVGKSSLVNGGLLPSLRQSSVRGEKLLPVLVRRYVWWEANLGVALEDSLRLRSEFAEKGSDLAEVTGREAGTGERGKGERSISPDNPQSLPTTALKAPDNVEDLLTALREQVRRNRREVLIFDQFEELFFAYGDPLAQRRFIRFLADSINQPSVKVIQSLREDYIHFLLACNRLSGMGVIGQDILSKNVLYPVGNFLVEDAKAIVRRLTAETPYDPEPALMDGFVEDQAGELGEVRPIELQIVGAQLQTDEITTLADYRDLGDSPKATLVQRYLDEVIEDCGEEHRELTEALLFLLTDERGTRPLKTRPELERELEELRVLLEDTDAELSALDLVLMILDGSGLVVVLPDEPDSRYQLVHDYLAEVIRKEFAPQQQFAKELAEKQKQLQAAEEEKAVLAEANAVLEEANQKASRRNTLSLGLLGVSLVVVV